MQQSDERVDSMPTAAEFINGFVKFVNSVGSNNQKVQVFQARYDMAQGTQVSMTCGLKEANATELSVEWSFKNQTFSEPVTLFNKFRTQNKMNEDIVDIKRYKFNVNERCYPKQTCNSTISIKPLRVYDSGTYICRLRTQGAEGEGSMVLNVRAIIPEDKPPTIVTLETVNVPNATYNETFVAYCTSNGYPEPGIEFYFLEDSRKILIPKSTTTWASFDSRSNLGSRHKLTIKPNGFERKPTIKIFCEATITKNEEIFKKKSNILKINYRYPPRILSGMPKKYQFRLYQEFNTTCLFETGNPPYTKLKWVGGSTPNGNVVIDQPKLAFHPSEATKQKAKKYTCVVSNEIGQDQITIDLEATYAPRITNSKQLTVEEGKDITLECAYDANPKPAIIWTGPENQNFLNTGRYLTLKKVRRSQGGSYICFARNVAGKDSGTIELIVQYAPILKFIAEPSDTIMIGTEFKMLCTVNSQPVETETKISKKIGSNFAKEFKVEGYWNESSTKSNALDTHHKYLVNVMEAQKKHSGIYICEAKNVIHPSRASLNITVEYPPEFNVKKELRVQEGSIMREKCNVSVQAKQVSIYWLNKNKEAILPKSDVLEFRKVSKSHSATYYCYTEVKFTNGKTKMKWKPMELLVEYAPVLKVLGAGVGNRYRAGANSRITMTCKSESYPAASFSWKFENKDVRFGPRVIAENTSLSSPSRYPIFQNASLILERVSEESYGEYKCIATNLAGTSEKTLQLATIGPPTQPTKVGAQAFNKYFEVSWNPQDDGGAPQHFVVGYRKPSQSTFQESEATSDSKYKINGLQWSTKYQFSVKACNKVECSEFTKPTNAIELSQAAIGAPIFPLKTILAVPLSVFLLILFFAILVFCCRTKFRRKSRRHIIVKENAVWHTDSKSNKTGENDVKDHVRFSDLPPPPPYTVKGVPVNHSNNNGIKYSTLKPKQILKHSNSNQYTSLPRFPPKGDGGLVQQIRFPVVNQNGKTTLPPNIPNGKQPVSTFKPRYRQSPPKSQLHGSEDKLIHSNCASSSSTISSVQIKPNHSTPPPNNHSKVAFTDATLTLMSPGGYSITSV